MESASWRRDNDSSKIGLAGSLLVHVAVAAIFVLGLATRHDHTQNIVDHSLLVFDLPGQFSQVRPKKQVTIAKPKSVIVKSLLKPSNAKVAPMAIVDGSAGGQVFIWTPPQPLTTYGTGFAVKALPAQSSYIDLPIPLIVVPGQESFATLIRFDGVVLLDVANKFAALGPRRRASLLTEVAIDLDGKAIGCSVTQGQVSSEIDVLACQLMMTMVFVPSKDVNGVPKTSFLHGTVLWDGSMFHFLIGTKEVHVSDSRKVVIVDVPLDSDISGSIQAVDPS